MNMNNRFSITSPRTAIAVGIFVGLIGVLFATTWIALASIGERRAAVLAAETTLAQLDGRSALGSNHSPASLAGAPAGSPFLEGPTLTVAGAALLQRIGRAVSEIGGNVVSSQVELEKAESKDGWIGLVVTCEIEPGSLQHLLYDLEAGMPFLFIDQLV